MSFLWPAVYKSIWKQFKIKYVFFYLDHYNQCSIKRSNKRPSVQDPKDFFKPKKQKQQQNEKKNEESEVILLVDEDIEQTDDSYLE